jgi:hypothetical protein
MKQGATLKETTHISQSLRDVNLQLQWVPNPCLQSTGRVGETAGVANNGPKVFFQPYRRAHYPPIKINLPA